MFYHAKNGRVNLDGTDMDYISFGVGPEILVMLPGLGDGLSTVRGKALPFALAYRAYAAGFTVYMFSRKNRLETGYSTKDMAGDQARAMEMLGITGAHVMGISQGGMIAQYLAIDHPELVRKLILACTAAGQNETIREAVGSWITLAERGDYKALFIDTAERTYSEKYLKRYRPLYPVLGRIGKPKDFSRFLIQAEACLGHNAVDGLDRIACPTLVLGGDSDRIVGAHSSEKLAAGIKDSTLHLWPGLGHGAYEEAEDFSTRVLAFLEGGSQENS